MLLNRTIPCLLLSAQSLVKTVRFSNRTYIGDPINAVKIFNECFVDEIIVLDIDASPRRCEPQFELISELAGECFMPLCYGGGVNTLNQVESLLRLGVEKVAFNTALFEAPEVVQAAAKKFGSQAIVASMDIEQNFWGRYRITSKSKASRKRAHSMDVLGWVDEIEAMGAGELLINDVTRDGTFRGYNIEVVRRISRHTRLPVIAMGGAGKVEDLASVCVAGGASAAAAGSLFVFQNNNRSVLINVPSSRELEEAYNTARSKSAEALQ